MASNALTLDTPRAASANGGEAFANWQSAMRQIEASNPEDDNSHLWAIVDASEVVIFADATPTPANAERKLWLTLQHSVTMADEEAAVIRCNPAPLIAKGDAFDWNVRLALSAIVTLRAMQGRT